MAGPAPENFGDAVRVVDGPVQPRSGWHIAAVASVGVLIIGAASLLLVKAVFKGAGWIECGPVCWSAFVEVHE